MSYTYPTQEAGRDFILRGITGPVLMLNLIRLRSVADYTDHPEIAPDFPISGREAYDRYAEHTMPFLTQSGGSIDVYAEGGKWLIGPADEHWDLMLLIKQRSVEAFLEFENNPDYVSGIGHRMAAISDSRLLPLSVVQAGEIQAT